MRFFDKDPSSKRKYSRISFKKRQKLIQEVEAQGCSLSYIAKKLKIKQSTARMILRKYKEFGQFRTKNFKNKRNTDLSQWGSTKNVEKVEVLIQNNKQSKQENVDEDMMIKIEPKVQQSYMGANNIPQYYWLYYMPLLNYIDYP